MPYRGGALPIVRLARLFGIDGDAATALARVRGRHRPGRGRPRSSIASSASARSWCRRSPIRWSRVDGVSGATELGDGRVVLILDLAALRRDPARAAAQIAALSA